VQRKKALDRISDDWLAKQQEPEQESIVLFNALVMLSFICVPKKLLDTFRGERAATSNT